MYRPKFSPKEALAAAIHGVIKMLMLQNGYDDNTADLVGAAIGGTVKGISIEKQTSIYSEIENAIKSAWIDIFSKEEYEYLSDDCKEELKKRVVSAENTFEIINANQPGSLLRSRIISILKQYTKWNGIELNTMARLMSDALLKEIYKIFDKDGILTLIARTDALLKNQNITIDRIRKLDDIQDSLQELSTDFYKQIEILQLIAHESQEHTDENLINKLREHCQNEDKKNGRLTEQSFIDFISSINVRRWNQAFNSSDSYKTEEHVGGVFSVYNSLIENEYSDNETCLTALKFYKTFYNIASDLRRIDVCDFLLSITADSLIPYARTMFRSEKDKELFLSDRFNDFWRSSLVQLFYEKMKVAKTEEEDYFWLVCADELLTLYQLVLSMEDNNL